MLYDYLMNLWSELIALGWKLPMLLVFGAGLWFLRQVPPHPLRRKAAQAMWVVLIGIVLQWVLNNVLPPFIRRQFSFEDDYYTTAGIFQVIALGLMLVQMLGYALLLRVLIQALRIRAQTR